MGSADDYSYGSSDSALDSAKQSAQNVADSAREMPQQIKRQTRGNPMAAGLVALGAGWLLGSLLPASREERRAAETVKQKAQPLMEDAKDQAREMGDLRESGEYETAKDRQGLLQARIGFLRQRISELSTINLAQIPKDQRKPGPGFVQAHNRCPLCGRPRAYFRRFDMCRICFRNLALDGKIPGVVKSSW